MNAIRCLGMHERDANASEEAQSHETLFEILKRAGRSIEALPWSHKSGNLSIIFSIQQQSVFVLRVISDTSTKMAREDTARCSKGRLSTQPALVLCQRKGVG